MNAHDLPENPSEAPITPFDSALACLIMLARLHQVAIEPEQIKHQFAGDSYASGGATLNSSTSP